MSDPAMEAFETWCDALNGEDEVPMCDARRNKLADEPGGCECMTCGAIFVGAEWDTECAICDPIPPRIMSKKPFPAGEYANAGDIEQTMKRCERESGRSVPADFRFSTHDGWMRFSLLELLGELEEYFEPKADIDTIDGDYGVPVVVANDEHRLLCDIRDCINAIEGR